jgi:hypothetical protein
MRRIQRLSIVTMVSLMPALAWTAPPADGPPEDSAPKTQGQTLDGRTQQQGPDSQTQTNPTAPPAPPPGGWGPPPTIQVNPQIQVQVNPKVDVEAKPQADADADADAKANAEANPKADANADIDTEIKSESNIESGQEASATPTPTPTPTPAPTKKVVRIIHKPVPPAPHVDKPVAKRRSGLMVAGLFTFGGTYIATAINGAYIYEHCDRARDEGACRQMSTKMLIPVAGPFMAMKDSSVRSNQVKLGILGGAQAAGALMSVAGIVMHVRDGQKPGNRFVNADGVKIGKKTRVAPLAGGDGGGVQLNVRF